MANKLVTYKDLSLQMDKQCGLVVGGIENEPGFVWVRWVGALSDSRESLSELMEV